MQREQHWGAKGNPEMQSVQPKAEKGAPQGEKGATLVCKVCNHKMQRVQLDCATPEGQGYNPGVQRVHSSGEKTITLRWKGCILGC